MYKEILLMLELIECELDDARWARRRDRYGGG